MSDIYVTIANFVLFTKISDKLPNVFPHLSGNVYHTSPYIVIFKGYKFRKITEKHNISAGKFSLIRLNVDYRTNRSNYHDSTYNIGIRLSFTFVTVVVLLFEPRHA